MTNQSGNTNHSSRFVLVDEESGNYFGVEYRLDDVKQRSSPPPLRDCRGDRGQLIETGSHLDAVVVVVVGVVRYAVCSDRGGGTHFGFDH